MTVQLFVLFLAVRVSLSARRCYDNNGEHECPSEKMSCVAGNLTAAGGQRSPSVEMAYGPIHYASFGGCVLDCSDQQLSELKGHLENIVIHGLNMTSDDIFCCEDNLCNRRVLGKPIRARRNLADELGQTYDFRGISINVAFF